MFERLELGIVEATHDELTENFFPRKSFSACYNDFDASSVSFFSNQV